MFIEGSVNVVVCEVESLLLDYVCFAGIFVVDGLVGGVLFFDLVFFYLALVVFLGF